MKHGAPALPLAAKGMTNELAKERAGRMAA